MLGPVLPAAIGSEVVLRMRSSNRRQRAPRLGKRSGLAWCPLPALVFLLLCGRMSGAAPAAVEQTYRSDDWVTKCEVGRGSARPDCSIAVPFAQTENGQEGSFALVVILRTGDVAIVGRPFPVRAVLRVGKNPPIECRQPRYCLFPRNLSRAAIKGLGDGALVLVDVYTVKEGYRFSLTSKGYQAGIAYIRAWGYRVFPE
jgi:hypothetical protein